MLYTLHYLVRFRLDLLLLVLVTLAGLGLTHRHLHRRTGRGLPAWLWLGTAALVLLGGLAAEWAARERYAQLQFVFSGFGPTYAAELEALGHEKISLETSVTDPLYLQIIEREKLWVGLNPAIADIYTFRRDAQGQIRLVVDSETDYDHNGRYEGEREQRTPIGEAYPEATPKFFSVLEGHPEFESQIMPDRWGVWVSSFTPLRNARGEVDAAVGIDYPADSWIYSLAASRGIVLAVTLVIISIIGAASAFISLMSSEIARRSAVQASLEQASTAAISASAAKSEFLALMSHEVRTPLSAIMGYANILVDTELNPKQRRYVDTINRAGTSLLELLNGILDYTRAESGKLVLERIPWAPALVVHEVMELMTVRAEEKGLLLNFENQLPGTLTLFGDPTRVRQVLLNLVSNAVKFTARGHVTARATWSPAFGRADRGRLCFEVIDTGSGIPADRVPLLFKAFSQADTSTTRHHGGTGLGLAICQRLADMMGGTIALQSSTKSGSIFSFALDCEAAEAGQAGYRSDAVTAPPIPLWNRALVIDDTKLNRELLRVMLQRMGLEADLAASGPEAVRLAAENNYAIIFTDLEMPDMDGFATTRLIREQELPGRHTPIVAISALTASGTRERCITAGMDEYLTKPVYVPALRSVMEAVEPRFKVAQRATQAPFSIPS